MYVFLYLIPGTAAALFRSSSPENSYIEIHKTTVREGTVRVTAKSKRTLNLIPISHKQKTSPILKL